MFVLELKDDEEREIVETALRHYADRMPYDTASRRLRVVTLDVAERVRVAMPEKTQ